MAAGRNDAEATSMERAELIYRVALLGILALSLVVRLHGLEGFGWENDEGTHIMLARLMNSGQRLYADVFSLSAPLFIASIALAFRVLGTTTAAARTIIVLYSMSGLLAVGLIARRIAGRVAAITAVILLSITPDFFLYSRACLGDVPAVGLGAFSILLAFYYCRRGQRSWLALSGLSLAAGLLIKVLSPFAVFLVTLIVIWHRFSEERRGQKTALDLLVFGLGLALPLLLCLLSLDSRAMYEQVVAFRWQVREAYPLNPLQNGRCIAEYFLTHRGLVILALYGGLALGLRKSRPIWWAAVWLLLAVTTMMVHTPLRDHQLTVFLPPLAILAGGAFGQMASHLTDLARRKTPLAWLGLGALAFYLWSLPATIQANLEASAAPQGGREQDAVAWLQKITTAHDWIISDDQMLVFGAGRHTPPSLADTSIVLIKSGYLTVEELLAQTEEYRPPVVISWSGRFLLLLPDYLAWAEENYLIQRVYDDQRRIFYALRPSADEIQHPLRADLGGVARLLGYDLEQESGLLELTLYWQARAEMDADYTVFVHLLDDAPQVRAQADGPPLHGLLPTTAWRPGEIIPDRHFLPFGEELAPGRYRLAVGLYSPHTGERLGNDQILLGEVTLEPQ